MVPIFTFFTAKTAGDTPRCEAGTTKLQLPQEVHAQVLACLAQDEPNYAQIGRLRLVSRDYRDEVDHVFSANLTRIATRYAVDHLQAPSATKLSAPATYVLARTTGLELVPREPRWWPLPWGRPARLADSVGAERLEDVLACASRCRAINLSKMRVKDGDGKSHQLKLPPDLFSFDLRDFVAPDSAQLIFDLPQIKKLSTSETAWFNDAPYAFTDNVTQGLVDLTLQIRCASNARARSIDVPSVSSLRLLTLSAPDPDVLPQAQPRVTLKSLVVASEQRQLLTKLALHHCLLKPSALSGINASTWSALTRLELCGAGIERLDMFTASTFPALEVLLLDGNWLGRHTSNQVSLAGFTQLRSFSMRSNRGLLPADRSPLLLPPGSRLRSVDLSSNSFSRGPDAARWLGQLLQQAPSLTQLTMNDVFPHPADHGELLHVHRVCSQLRPTLRLEAAPLHVRLAPDAFPG